MAVRLIATNNVPLMLLSATCGPEAAEAIRSNLMLQPEDINMIDGELTSPEIRVIWVMMKSTLKSCDDLLRLYAPHTRVPADKIIPTIIYSGTQNATFQVMKVVKEARHIKRHEYDPGLDSGMPKGPAARRFGKACRGCTPFPAGCTPSIGVRPCQTGVQSLHACLEGVQSLHALWTGVQALHTCRLTNPPPSSTTQICKQMTGHARQTLTRPNHQVPLSHPGPCFGPKGA
ncbi:hypothetical protein PCANC_12480 [Puccinia coronata f. sp. avenae]|uniref:Helicase ATP-binding domain-containing protein n=1 Tax=Puccinia coronata f. sp. avenae TaxID=200324 RepID=A0A2N5ULI8_9BASI|nr:hypothetical protein PCANC_12480 [Puccinia coronata f. sp. avenae]